MSLSSLRQKSVLLCVIHSIINSPPVTVAMTDRATDQTKVETDYKLHRSCACRVFFKRARLSTGSLGVRLRLHAKAATICPKFSNRLGLIKCHRFIVTLWSVDSTRTVYRRTIALPLITHLSLAFSVSQTHYISLSLSLLLCQVSRGGAQSNSSGCILYFCRQVPAALS